MNSYTEIYKTGAINTLALVLTVFLAFFLYTANANAVDQTPWTTLLGTTDFDNADDIAVDALGNSYVTGDTSGALSGPSQGSADIIVAKFDPAGNNLWVVQEGTIEFDRATRIALDDAGNVYVTGYTRGDLFVGGEGDGFFDYFIAKYDTNGNFLWGKQYGAPLGQYGFGIDVAPSGDIYVCGEQYQLIPNAAVTYYAFLTKFDSTGTQIWTDVFGEPTIGAGGNQADEECRGVAVGDDGFIYITGSAGDSLTAGDPDPDLGGGDIFFAKYTSGGNQLWLTETGTPLWDRAGKIAVDAAGNSYTSGWTAAGGLDFGDMLTVKVNTNGVRQWEVRESTTTLDEGYGVAVDGNGIVYAVGRYGVGPALALFKYDSNGSQLSLDTMSSGNGDYPAAISVDSAGTNYYIAGDTSGDLDGQTNTQIGAADIFVIHNKPAPVPVAVLVTVPDVVGLAQAAAELAITNAGLVPDVTTAFSDFMPVGTVISQSPVGGIEAAENSTVSLVVSAGIAPTDTDGDGVFDNSDNCTQVANPLQVDTDGDGYGNMCDGDLNNDNIINVSDYSTFLFAFGGTDPTADFNADGFVNVSDYSMFLFMFGGPPGPSGLAP